VVDVNQANQQSEELDVRHIVQVAWKTRGYVLLAAVLVSIVYWLYALLTVSTATTTVVGDIKLNFPGIDRLEYPNNSPFSTSDLISPAVLTHLMGSDLLSEHYSDSTELAKDLSVSHYSPRRAVLIEEYTRQADNKKLTVAELDELRVNLEKKLSEASNSSLRLSFKPVSGITEVEAEKVLVDLVATWRRHMIDTEAVLRDTRVLSSGVKLNEEVLRESSYFFGRDLIKNYVNLLVDEIDSIVVHYPAAGNISAKGSDMTLRELRHAILDFYNYHVEMALLPVKQFGLSKSLAEEEFYFASQLQVNQSSQVRVQETIQATERVLATYRGESSSEGKLSAVAGSRAESASTPHLSGEFIDKMLDLGERSSDLAFQQSLSKDILQAEAKLDVLRAKEDDLIRVLDYLKNSQSNKALLALYGPKLDAGMDRIIAKLNSYVAVFAEIKELVENKKYGSQGLAYQLVLSSERGIFLSLTNMRQYILCLLISVLLVFGISFMVQLYLSGED